MTQQHEIPNPALDEVLAASGTALQEAQGNPDRAYDIFNSAMSRCLGSYPRHKLLTHFCEVPKEKNVLEQYSNLTISAKDAMDALNLNCLEDLMLAINGAGLPLPHVDRQGSAQMAKNFLGLHGTQMRHCELVIMDAGPLIKLALANRLDLLLAFNLRVYIPDEVYFEAAEKFAWEDESTPTPDKVRLVTWVTEQKARGRVFCPDTLVGEAAARKRATGDYSPTQKNHRKNTGELAAHDFFNNREDWGHAGEPALFLIDDGPGVDKVKLQNLDECILSTYSMLVVLELEHLIESADAVWADVAKLPSTT